MEKGIIIIGSSDNVLQAERGPEVDEFWQVVRCNRAPIAGYQKHVGTKCTERFVNPEMLRNTYSADTSPLQVHEISDCVISCWDKCTPREFYTHWNSTTTFKEVTNDWKVKLNHLDIPFNNSHKPTCGFQAIMHYIWIKPTIYGFDLDADHIFHHYWRKEKRNSTYHNHDFEKQALRALIDIGQINLL